MKMHVLSGGRLQMRKRVYFPDADREATIELPVSCFLLRHPQGNVLFDSGCHPSTASDAPARWGDMARAMKTIGRPNQNVVDELKCVGLSPDDVDVVIASHLHSDHCGCNGFFRKATVLCQARELEAAQAPDADKQGYLPVDWNQGKIEAVDGQRDLFGDDRIVLIPVPGHTPGTMGAMVNLDQSSSFFLASDAVSMRDSLDRDLIPRNTWNTELFAASLKEIRRMDRSGVTVLCGHDDGQWAGLRKGADAYG